VTSCDAAAAVGRSLGSLATMRRSPLFFAATALVLAACGGGSDEQSTPTTRQSTTTVPPSSTTTTRPADLNAARVTLTPVAGITGGTAMAVRTGDTALYVAVQQGRIVAIRDGQVDPTPVLDLTGNIRAGGEQGLLGIAFSPDATLLYVHSTAPSGDSRLEEYAFVASPGGGGRADPATARTVLTAPGLQANHNGGQLAFDPDGMLWMALGDGGSQGDSGAGHVPGGNAQSLEQLLGKLLRIDPQPSGSSPYTIPADNPFAAGGGRPEIWAFGLRNPWRFSFDRETGDLWIADVGGSDREEIDLAPAPERGRGTNFGWNRVEGTVTHDAVPPGAVGPVHEVDHSNGDCSITGGFVYRGARIPDLVGAYVYSDYCNGAIRALRVDGTTVVVARDLGISERQISSFGEDAAGELYVVSQQDGIFRIDPAA